jgi:adenylate cyclase
MSPEPTDDNEWLQFLSEGEPGLRHLKHMMRLLPSSPRCKLCNSPFKGWGGMIMRWAGRDQSRYNPRYCEKCDRFENPGGAEVELTMLFADVRGSTTLAEQMSPLEFSRLMNRFYVVATDVLVDTDAMVDRLIGDEVIGLYIPGLAGHEHARRAIEAAQGLLKGTGHNQRNGPWLPIGVGVHTGLAFVGVVGGVGDNPTDFTALGDNVNITARLAAQAGPGEILVSDAAYSAANLNLEDLDHRLMELKGKSEPVGVHVLRVESG